MSVRRALLVGINAYPDAPLRGCINDVRQMKGLLKQFYGFQDDGIKLLLDGDATAAGIKAGLAWLAEGGADADAVRIFHYSGHGTYVADKNGDEPDGRDECLVPFDYKSAGFITDDVLKTLYDRFPVSGNLTLVMDSCHSGTVNKAPLRTSCSDSCPCPMRSRRRSMPPPPSSSRISRSTCSRRSRSCGARI